jgi:P-type E1-E2 ATPase
LQDGVKEHLAELSKVLTIHVVTGNTYGTVSEEMRGMPCRVVQLQADGQADAKYDIVVGLGADATVAIGNGRNDVPMLRAAALGIAVVGPEGAAYQALEVADVVIGNIDAALGLLRHPQRLVATLRS